MILKVKRLTPDAKLPAKAHKSDAGFDLTATSYKYDEKIDCHIYGTGIAIEMEEDYVGLIYPRSSNRKTDAYMCNHVGIIDPNFRGEIMVSFKNRSTDNFVRPYEVGDRVAQLIINKLPIVHIVETDTLNESERGEGGHGSTGR